MSQCEFQLCCSREGRKVQGLSHMATAWHEIQGQHLHVLQAGNGTLKGLATILQIAT